VRAHARIARFKVLAQGPLKYNAEKQPKFYLKKKHTEQKYIVTISIPTRTKQAVPTKGNTQSKVNIMTQANQASQVKETVFTLSNVLTAIGRGNDRWAAKQGAVTECPDLKKARGYWDDALCIFAATMLKRARIEEIDFLSTIADKMGVKAIMRVSEFFACLHAKDYSKLDGVTAL
jgi:hypothetical protein